MKPFKNSLQTRPIRLPNSERRGNHPERIRPSNRPIEETIGDREYVLKQSEDLDRFVEGSLTNFLLKLDPEQEKLKDFGKQGPILVKDGP